jgi:hypothetical protein
MKICLTITLVILFNIQSYPQWQEDMRLTNDTAFSQTSYNNAWCIAAEGNFVHAVWYDNRDGNNEIYYKRSTDGGESWLADTRLTIDTAVSCNPTVSASGQVVHVIWNDFRSGYSDIYYKRSTDNGESWAVDKRLTLNAYASNPSMSVSGSIVHAAWYDDRDGNFEEYYKRSLDGGQNWNPDIRLTNNIGNSLRPSISVSGLTVHLVWYDDRDGMLQIYYKRSTDGGNSWGADAKLTNSGYTAGFPSISASGLGVNVVWLDARNGLPYIFYKRSTDGGVNWETDTQLTGGIYSTGSPSISSSGLVVNVVWVDNRNGSFELYQKRSTDGGESWQTDTRLTNKSGNSENPSVAVSGSVVHTIWSDNRDGNPEIYYKQDPSGNIVSVENISPDLPDNFKLYQNYPNPFNPATTISYSIPKISFVSLKVYDILGREIKTLVNEDMTAGNYSVNFDASNLAPGIYFYTIKAGAFVRCKKMVLLK